MDDLLALMESDVPELDPSGHRETSATPSSASGQVYDSINQTRSVDVSRNPVIASSSTSFNNAEVGVDTRLGIRMLKRRVSSSDLTDLLETYTYYSTAALSAMSLSALNRLLVEPAAVVDAVTVGGQMDIITVGIVFTNSGTRIASSGSAFCTLSIGNLNTGPCVTVFLFGEAYTSACRSCVPGRVIALLMPRLLPSKDNNNKGGQKALATNLPISFSVNAKDQLIVVADARDYGTCRAMITCRGGFRQNHPGVDSHADVGGGPKLCKNYVDKRISEYCTAHRKLALVNSTNSNSSMKKGTAGGASNKGLTFVQQLRQEQQMRQTTTITGSNNILNASKLNHNNNALLNTNSGHRQGNVFVRHDGHHQVNNKNQSLVSNVGVRNVSQAATVTPPLLLAPKHMVKQGIVLLSNSDSRVPHQRNMAQLSRTGLGVVGAGHAKTSESTRPIINLSRYSEGTKRRSSLTISGNPEKKSRPVSVNTDKEGFDGSVPVPKPNKLFGGRRSFQQHCCFATTETPVHAATDPLAVNRNEALVAQVRDRQRQIACALQDSETRMNSTKRQGKAGLTKTMPVQAEGEGSDALLTDISNIDFEKIASAKSRFANEVDAEEYVKSRQVVTELEKKEEKAQAKEKKDQAKSGGQTVDGAGIVKQWYCAQCDRNTSFRPAVCVRVGHKVTLDRNIKTGESVEESRVKLTNKNVADGGLVLGAGLEWSSRWSRFTY